MDPATRRLIEALHQAPYQCVLAVTGGGTQAAALLLNVPGGSRTVLEVVVPYGERALAEYLGSRPESFCSPATAHNMAGRAYQRASWLAPGQPVVGAACTASLATDRPKRGVHRFYVAVRTSAHLATYTLILTKGARSREEEEAVLDAVLLNALAAAFGVADRVMPPLLAGEEVQTEVLPSTGPLERFLRGELATLCAGVDGRLHEAERPTVLLPGAFNPVHEGHWGMAAAAERLTGQPVAFELSVTNVDKPPLPDQEVRRRLHQFTWRAPVWLTRAPTFVEKARLFPGVVFVVGADTAQRIVAPRYYGDSATHMLAALEQIRAQGCRFLVAGRSDASGNCLTLAQVAVPDAYRDCFTDIPAAEFFLPISSSQIRVNEPAGDRLAAGMPPRRSV